MPPRIAHKYNLRSSLNKVSDFNIILPEARDTKDVVDHLTPDTTKIFAHTETDGTVVHVRVYQRTSRRYITTISGLSAELSLKKILKHMKKQFSCNGTIKTDPQNEEILQLSGDQRNLVKSFLLNQGIVSNTQQIKLHGF